MNKCENPDPACDSREKKTRKPGEAGSTPAPAASLNTTIRYGLEWPATTSEVTIQLWFYRNWTPKLLEHGALQKWEHLELAIRALWPRNSTDGKRLFDFHSWTRKRCRLFCEHQRNIWWGPSSSGKTTDCAAIILADWYSAPDRTTAILASTTRPSLLRRIWREVLRLHAFAKNAHDAPGNYVKSLMAIVYGKENEENPVNAIFGVAVQQGATADAMANLIGVHNDYVRLVIDECQGTRQAAVDAWDNLEAGREPRFVAMGNPSSKLDPLGRISTPLGGWESIHTTNMDNLESEWDSVFGHVAFFDGRDSPGIRDPERFFFLITQAMIDKMAATKGVNSPSFWSQRIGFLPPDNIVGTVMSRGYLTFGTGKTTAPAWKEPPMLVAGLDPAFTDGGDTAKFCWGQAGTTTNEKKHIHICGMIPIAIRATADELKTFNLASDIKAALDERGIPANNLAADVTAVSTTFGDVLASKIGNGFVRVSFGVKPDELLVDAYSQKQAKDEYADMVTELWMDVAAFARYGQLSGIPEQAFLEFCERRTTHTDKMMADQDHAAVERKKDFIQRIGHSPDDADALACLVRAVRSRLSWVPGQDGDQMIAGQRAKKAAVRSGLIEITYREEPPQHRMLSLKERMRLAKAVDAPRYHE